MIDRRHASERSEWSESKRLGGWQERSPPTPSDYLTSPHGAPGSFFNPWDPMVFRLSSWLRARAGRNPYAGARRKLRPARTAGPPLQTLPEPRRGDLAVTWVGHSTFVVQEGDDTIVTDPHWGRRALVLSRLVRPGVELGALPEEPIALVSHDHYDHLDVGTVRRMPPGTTWFVPLGLAAWFRRIAPEARVRELDWWQSVRHGRFTLTFLPAQHWGNRLSHGRNAALWGGWVVESESRSWFFAGDSGYFEGYAEFGRLFPRLDLAFLPIGAFEPRRFVRYQHMDPAEAYQVFADLDARTMVPMHWGTFDLTNEPPDLAPRLLAAEIVERGGDPTSVLQMTIGETRIDYGARAIRSVA